MASVRFAPIGDATTPFSGTFDGQGHVISNLSIRSNVTDVGFFGVVNRGTVTNLQIAKASVVGEPLDCGGQRVNAGILAGQFTSGAISNSSTTGKVVAITKQTSDCGTYANAGGLIGLTTGGTVDQAWSRASVTATAAATVGGLIGFSDHSLLSNIHASGDVRAGEVGGGSVSFSAGLVGYVDGGFAHVSYASGNVTLLGDGYEGGLIGWAQGFADIADTYATGNVGGNGDYRESGGLIGISTVAITRSFATGSVTGSGPRAAGGLIGHHGGQDLTQSFALGDVTGISGDVPCSVGGLIGQFDSASIIEVYSVGHVVYRCNPNGGPINRGGLAGMITGSTAATSAYWDVTTSRLSNSPDGSPLTTNALRSALPAGFGADWDYTRAVSFPYLVNSPLNFMAPLATLVVSNNVFVFLPIEQRDDTQYATAPVHADAASLAAVYTIIARGIGQAENVAQLKGVKIDAYFWNDASQTATWQGPVTDKATLGSLVPLSANATLAPVVREMRAYSLVILRGTYPLDGGGHGTLWMLGTMYTTGSDGKASAIVANDPWTGAQVQIDVATKAVVKPANFALSGFVVNGYQTVSVQ